MAMWWVKKRDITLDSKEITLIRRISFKEFYADLTTLVKFYLPNWHETNLKPEGPFM